MTGVSHIDVCIRHEMFFKEKVFIHTLFLTALGTTEV